jgi:hypothetical protein
VAVRWWLGVACIVSCITTSIAGHAQQGGSASEQAPQRLALVIGNSQYASLPPAAACDASARVAAAALGRAGFAVTAKPNVSNGEMGGAIAEFADAVAKAPSANIVVYVCGYMVDFDKRAFLLPASANLERETDVLTQGVPARRLVDSIARANIHAGVLLLDAIAKPGSTASSALNPVISGLQSVDLAAMIAGVAGAQPQGTTPLGAALADALAGPDIEVGALVSSLGQTIAPISGMSVAMGKPSAPAWLVGGPVVAPPAPAPAPAVAAPVAPAPDVQAAPELAKLPPTDQRRIQAALRQLGYYDGQIDGIVGPEQRAAIRRFQHELGAAMTGNLTPTELSRLLAASH